MCCVLSSRPPHGWWSSHPIADFTSIHRRLVVISQFGEQEKDVFNILSKTDHCAETGGILMQQETAGSAALRIIVFTSRLFSLLPLGWIIISETISMTLHNIVWIYVSHPFPCRNWQNRYNSLLRYKSIKCVNNLGYIIFLCLVVSITEISVATAVEQTLKTFYLGLKRLNMFFCIFNSSMFFFPETVFP